jgi:hypothetical protein
MKTAMREVLKPCVLKSSIKKKIDVPIIDLLRKEFEELSFDHED